MLIKMSVSRYDLFTRRSDSAAEKHALLMNLCKRIETKIGDAYTMLTHGSLDERKRSRFQLAD